MLFGLSANFIVSSNSLSDLIIEKFPFFNMTCQHHGVGAVKAIL